MIYLDNAATGGYKPRTVIDAYETVIKYLSANPGRSGHRLAVTGAEIVYSCREKAARFFDCNPDRVVFTKNCTEALNTAIFGTLKRGGKIITTIFEHNSVLRPLYFLKEQSLIDLDIVKPDAQRNIAQAIENKITKNTYLIIATAINNVTGQLLPIDKIGEIAKKYGVMFLVDGAQGAGHIPLSLKKQNISMLALAGHKGLYGIMGSGLLCFNDDITIRPICFGGTGTNSFSQTMGDTYPEMLEAGTLNLPAIASLKEGLEYVKKNITLFSKQLTKNSEKIICQLSEMKNVKVFSKPNPAGIISFEINNIPSTTVADILNHDYDIAVRSGFHCAPLTHKFLKTQEYGLTRVSLSAQNSPHEISRLIDAVYKISR